MNAFEAKWFKVDEMGLEHKPSSVGNEMQATNAASIQLSRLPFRYESDPFGTLYSIFLSQLSSSCIDTTMFVFSVPLPLH